MSILASLWQNYDKLVPLSMSLIYRNTPIKMLIGLMVNYLWLILIQEKKKMSGTQLVVIIFNHAEETYHSLIIVSSEGQVSAGLVWEPAYMQKQHQLCCVQLTSK